MDEPDHSTYRGALNPYLSPRRSSAGEPFVDEITRAALDETHRGRSDRLRRRPGQRGSRCLHAGDDGRRAQEMEHLQRAAHLSVYTPEHSPDRRRRSTPSTAQMGIDILNNMFEIRENPRPGLVNALLQLRIDGEPAPDHGDSGQPRAHHRWRLRHHHRAHRPCTGMARRERRTSASCSAASAIRCCNPPPEEFLRFFTPGPRRRRAFSEDMSSGNTVQEGERLWISWAMANRDPSVFDDPNEIIMDRKGNRHFSFGIGVHRCVGFQRRTLGVQVDADSSARPDAGLRLRSRRAPSTTRPSASSRACSTYPPTFTPGPSAGPRSRRDAGQTAADLRRAGTRRGRSPSARKPPLSIDLPTGEVERVGERSARRPVAACVKRGCHRTDQRRRIHV